MDEFNLLKKLERVKAPPDFEEKVLARLDMRRKKDLKLKRLRFSLAGAFSTALIIFVLVNVFIFHRKSPVEISELNKGISTASQKEVNLGRESIPVIETVDYKGEIQTLSSQQRTIYILEHVADAKGAVIKY
jgi:hypothetical protein